jgi:hypothetical protein
VTVAKNTIPTICLQRKKSAAARISPPKPFARQFSSPLSGAL